MLWSQSETDMEIGLIYSSEDPRQVKATRFIKRFIQERGVLAKVVEQVQPVNSPTVIINGHELADKRRRPRKPNDPMYPDISAIARALEHHLWTL